MVRSSYAPQTWGEVKAGFVASQVIGVQATCATGTSQNIDTRMTDDVLFRGVKLIAQNTSFGDTVSVTVVDVDGVYSPAGTVLSAPVLNFNISSDQQLQADYESIAPFKLLAGLYLRITYNSVGGLLNFTKLGADFLLVKVLQ